ncbi:hypothetical protein INT48_000842 [Thamnidium elegans]|uniref:Cryptochrome DASH n=1 Tax=Thamnidium elegans TaxID=101142 RepID=A0A8H7VYY1_9FUNG|nr:hypothetical protein INT48_000842 [Thamnidium elegans]
MVVMKPINICYFRNILRVHDNQSLYHALQSNHSQILPVVCLDPRMVDISLLNDQLDQHYKTPKTWYFQLERCANFRTRFYLECVMSLKQELLKKNSDLLILFGKPEELFPKLQTHLLKNYLKLDQIHIHKEYAFEELEVEKSLASKKLPLTYHHDTTMVHPDDLDFAFEKTYKVYTHFRKRIEKMDHPVRSPLAIPDTLPPFPDIVWQFNHCEDQAKHLDKLYQDVSVKQDDRNAFPWEGGEQSAKDRLNQYLFQSDGMIDYKHTRNGLIGTEYSTKFSVFLAHGCLSPRLIWHEMNRFEKEQAKSGKKRQIKSMGDDDGIYWVKFELLWRDFFRFLVAGSGKKVFMLHGFRDLNKPVDESNKPKNSYLNKVWKTNDEQFNKWKNSQTGSPFIDACMRELLLTGFMNNRGRQNVASYLAKDLEMDWRIGAEYFESMLKDHDVYSNYGNWQYVSGVGCDPREGFRHFNVLKQSKDYDPYGSYIKLWCPELRDLPDQFVHCPWLMSPEEQKTYNCIIGQDYPKPMIIVENWKRHYPAATAKGKLSNYFTKDEKKKKPKLFK